MNDSAITTDPHLARRHRWGRLFEWVCKLATWACLGILAIMILGIVANGWPHLKWSFLTSFDSSDVEMAGIKAGIWGSFWLISLMVLFSIPVGIGAAVYLEEYAKPTRLTRLIQLNILNLAGVPSIVYGILGVTVFGHMFGFFGSSAPRDAVWALPFGNKVLTGAFTLSLLILPVVIISTQEALRAIPASLRHSSFALGATQWQTIRYQVLPAAMPGILTGIILAVSRAVGESAPLIMVGALTYVSSTPGNIGSVTEFFTHPKGILEAPFDVFTAMPLVIYNWASQAGDDYQSLASAGIVVLLVILLLMNTAAVVIRQRFQNWIRW